MVLRGNKNVMESILFNYEVFHFKADSRKLVGRTDVQLLCKHRGERLYPERLGESGNQLVSGTQILPPLDPFQDIYTS